MSANHGVLAQPVRASACRAEGHGFESRTHRHALVVKRISRLATNQESARLRTGGAVS